MTCLGNKEWSNRYLDGELSPSEQIHFEQHLATCQACQHELAQTQTLFAVLDALQDAPVPVSLRQTVLSGLPRHSTPPLARWVLVAQVVATVILLALAWPALNAWYRQISAWFAPGWLAHLTAGIAAWWQTTQTWLALTLAVDIDLAWPRGLGLGWQQAVLMVLTLVSLWVLGNRLLFVAKSNETGGTT